MIFHIFAPTEDDIFVGPRASVFYASIPRGAYEEGVHLRLTLTLCCRARARSNGLFFLVRLFPEFLSSPDRPCPVSGLR